VNWAEGLQWTYALALVGGGLTLLSVGGRTSARKIWALALFVVSLRHGLDAFMLGYKGYIYASYPFSFGYFGVLLVALGCAAAAGRRPSFIVLLYFVPFFGWIPAAAYLGYDRITGVTPLFIAITAAILSAAVKVWRGGRSRELILILASSLVMLAISFAHLATSLPPFGYSPILWAAIFAFMLSFLLGERGREELSNITAGFQGAFLTDPSGRLVYISNIEGVGPPSKFVGEPPALLIAKEERERFNEWLDSSKKTATFRLKGAGVTVEFSREPSHLGTLFIIDYHKEGEVGAPDPEDELLKNIGVPAMAADPVSGLIKKVNSGAAGFARVGDHFWSVAQPGGFEGFREEVEKAIVAGPHTFDADILTEKGVVKNIVRAERRIVGGRDSLIIEFGGSPAQREVTRLAGTAHDLGNLLQTIVACCDNAGDGGVLSDVKAAALRGGDLAKELLAASSGRVPGVPPAAASRSALDLAEVIDSLGALMERALPKNISLKVDVEEGLPGIFANRTHVEQIIMNLLINAREALAGIPDPEIVLSLEGERGESRVSVSDNGPGVPPELEERIFEEAFTTRGDSGGSGLGLMMAATLAELNGARVSLTDNSTRGATFTLTFSLKSRHVVVVEPDPLFRAELVMALQDGGWEVSALHDGAGFKETFSGLSRPPAAVITELILP